MFRSLSPLISALSICMVLSGCGEPVPPSESVEPVRPVKSFLIDTASNTTTRRFPARIDAGRRVELSFRVSGILKELPVKEGDEVEKGQLLAALDPTDSQITYTERKASFDSAKRNFNRAQELLKKGNISDMDYDRLEVAYKSAESALKAAQQVLSYTRLTAPFSGIISRRYLHNFEEVQAKQPILGLQDISELEVKFDVPEHLLRSHDEAKDQVSASVSFTDIPGVSFPLTFREITTQADEKTQTFQATYTMRKLERATILPGMTAKVKVTIRREAANPTLTVPASAIIGDDKLDPQAWVIDEARMTVTPRSVKVGRLLGEGIEITEGLKPGERIVSAGAPFLVEGMKVRLIPEHEQAVQRADDLKYQ